MIFNPGVAFSGTTTTDNAIVRWDSTTGRFIQNSMGTISDSGFMNGILGLDTTDTDITFYANSTTGSDSYDGTSATFVSGTVGPKLTLDGTNGLFSIVPLIGPGIVTLNLVGTFTRSGTTVYRLPSVFNKKGDSDFPSIIRVTGDVANPSNVILRNFSSTGSMYAANVGTNLWDFDGVTFDDGRVGISSIGGYVRFKNVYATNIRDGGPYFQAARGGVLTLGAATLPLTFSCNATGSITAIVFAAQIYGYLDWQPNQTVTISGIKNNSGISIGGFGRMVHTNGTIIINGDATVGGDVGVQVTGFGFVTMRNLTIDKMTNASSTRQCGVYMTDSFSSWLQVGGTTLTVTNSTRGIFLTPISKWRDSSAATYTFTTVTTPVTVSHGAVADSTNTFSGAAITYVSGGSATAIHGYDDRYMKTTDYAQTFLLMGG